MSAAPDVSPAGAGRKRWRWWLLLPVAVFLCVALVFAAALRSGDPAKLPSALIGREAPAFAFPPLEGLADERGPLPGFSGADLARGKATIVNFWASWCVSCVEEHALLMDLARRTGADLYGVAYKDQPGAARRFLGRYGNPFSAVGTDPTGRGAIEWGVYGMPETFVADGTGRIAAKHVGPLTREAIEATILPAVAAAGRPRPPQGTP